MMTTGGSAARIVPSSGIVTWKSDSSSSRYPSNSSSARSISSMSSTGGRSRGLERAQQRPLDEKVLGEQLARRGFAIHRVRRLEHPDLQDLPRIVPLVDRVIDVEPFVALQPDQLCLQGRRENLRDLGFADACFALEEQRPLQPERQVNGQRKPPVGHILLRRRGLARRRQRTTASEGSRGSGGSRGSRGSGVQGVQVGFRGKGSSVQQVRTR